MKNNIVIPEHELEITASRSGGPGGQHVNKTNSRITIRWNVKNTHVLNEEQKERVLQKLQSRLTSDGDLIVHNSASRSQLQNKQLALAQLAQEVRQALHVPKKRMATKISKSVKETRLQTKTHRSTLKKMRSKKITYD
jgi:ribosome-associated protein